MNRAGMFWCPAATGTNDAGSSRQRAGHSAGHVGRRSFVGRFSLFEHRQTSVGLHHDRQPAALAINGCDFGGASHVHASAAIQGHDVRAPFLDKFRSLRRLAVRPIAAQLLNPTLSRMFVGIFVFLFLVLIMFFVLECIVQPFCCDIVDFKFGIGRRRRSQFSVEETPIATDRTTMFRLPGSVRL